MLFRSCTYQFAKDYLICVVTSYYKHCEFITCDQEPPKLSKSCNSDPIDQKVNTRSLEHEEFQTCLQPPLHWQVD